MGFGSNFRDAVESTGIADILNEFGFDIFDPFGTQKAVDALRAAGRIEEALQLENLAFRKQIFGETAGFRERADIAGAELLSRAQAPLAGNEEFQSDIKEALTQQRISFGAFGLGDSTAFGRAAGETTAEITSRERQRRVNILQFLSGGAETGISGALSAQQLSTQAGLARAQSAANVGAAQARGAQQFIQAGTDIVGAVAGAGGLF